MTRYNRDRLARLLLQGWHASTQTDERERLLDAVTHVVRRSQPGAIAAANQGEETHE